MVVSYPRFFNLDGGNVFHLCAGIRAQSAQRLNDAVIQADGSIGVAAVRAGFDYVNMQDVLDGHEQCDDDPAINGLKWISPSKGISAPESYHPNKLGHQLMADRVPRVFDEPVEPSFAIKPAQTVTRSFSVDHGDVHVVTGWPGSDVVTTLVSPSGTRYTRDSHSGADHDSGPTYEWYDVPNAEHGTWTAEMYGADVAAAGEGVTFHASDDAVPNQRPTADFTTTTNAKASTFDASGSTDSDETIESYTWDFGDGTTATGKTVQHTYGAASGSYQVTLRVEDDGGSTNYATNDTPVGSSGVSVASALHLTSGMSLTGPVTVRGDVTCDSQAHVNGDLVVAGTLTVTNSCEITGNVYAAGAVSMTANAKIDGNVITPSSIRLQSSNKTSGDVFTGGAVTSIDGATVADLHARGALLGTISEGYTVPTLRLPAVSAIAEPVTADAERISWAQWMNATATANAAPRWSKGRTSNPGCTMAPWSDSVNAPTVTVGTNTVVDARVCTAAALQGMTVRLAGDLTITANRFSTIDGVRCVSADGAAHRVRIVTPGKPTLGTAGSVQLSAGTNAETQVTLDIDASGTLTAADRSDLSGTVSSGGLNGSGTVQIGPR